MDLSNTQMQEFDAIDAAQAGHTRRQTHGHLSQNLENIRTTVGTRQANWNRPNNMNCHVSQFGADTHQAQVCVQSESSANLASSRSQNTRPEANPSQSVQAIKNRRSLEDK